MQFTSPSKTEGLLYQWRFETKHLIKQGFPLPETRQHLKTGTIVMVTSAFQGGATL